MTDRTLDEDTDAAAEDAAEETPKSRLGGKRRLIIFGGAGLLLLVGTGGTLYFTGIVGKLLGTNKAETAEAAAAPAPPKPSVFFDLPDLLVNLNSTGRKASFLKISISLDLEDLRDSGGIYSLREELLARVNAAASPAKVKDVLFKEMLVQ